MKKKKTNSINSKQQYHKVPLVWSMYGSVTVEAASIDEAVEIALGQETSLPDNAFYLDDSVECDKEIGAEILQHH